MNATISWQMFAAAPPDVCVASGVRALVLGATLSSRGFSDVCASAVCVEKASAKTRSGEARTCALGPNCRPVWCCLRVGPAAPGIPAPTLADQVIPGVADANARHRLQLVRWLLRRRIGNARERRED